MHANHKYVKKKKTMNKESTEREHKEMLLRKVATPTEVIKFGGNKAVRRRLK